MNLIFFIKNKFLLVFVLVLLCMNIVRGQDSLQIEPKPFPKLILTFSPLNLVNFRVPAAQLGVEYRIANKLSLQHEVGYIFRKDKRMGRLSNKQGFRTRHELRYYFDGMDNPKENSYWGLQFRYWKFSSPLENNFFREGGQYQQRISINVDQSAIGGGISYGDNIVNKKKFVFDVGGSVGFIYLKNNPDKIPDDAELIDDSFSFSRDHSSFYDSTQPYLLATLKIGFAL